MVNYIKNKGEYDTILKESSKLVVIDFTASWCPPCRMIAPIFEAIAAEFPNAIFVKVDVDEASDVAEACQISSMPTFQFYKGGKKVHEFSGASEAKIRDAVKKYI
mmetsp:Transcript_15366/g.22608  ORF Transcript_15366/g.22608 Transcript_15366/m.22608 type:complete len:105 (+) Transcript_15366:55-369(+)|eukprot:CAMPEP_0195516602 /NCGR_PEP_ID=MMETSP0794_2-20130614/7975_1 /TAXON_ID=515487 /ORGANISM="Stephanopyxis turris, Strain CCMP 815" /LENGTH=104 /DNA_ID=CAMNT_0040645249 /DNA_START=42 /DNA_END=356 /DNA_ORIENTATION=+